MTVTTLQVDWMEGAAAERVREVLVGEANCITLFLHSFQPRKRKLVYNLRQLDPRSFFAETKYFPLKCLLSLIFMFLPLSAFPAAAVIRKCNFLIFRKLSLLFAGMVTVFTFHILPTSLE